MLAVASSAKTTPPIGSNTSLLRLPMPFAKLDLQDRTPKSVLFQSEVSVSGSATGSLIGDPSLLPPCGHPDRTQWLQRLRRQATWDPLPWVSAIETARLEVDAGLLSVLAGHLDAALCLRLLQAWWEQGCPDPPWPSWIGRLRDPAIADWLRQRLLTWEKDRSTALEPELLTLLGLQRQPSDGALLAAWAQAPLPLRLRRAALEGLAAGLSAWPLAQLRVDLRRLVLDLDPDLAGEALNLLARLPAARRDLLALGAVALDPGVEKRRQRRLAALPSRPLLLLVHGRASGVVPAELMDLAADVARRRGAPVLLEALSGEPPQPPPGWGDASLTLVPLLLLPGNHVRFDCPAIAERWRLLGPVQRLPFLGAWPCWQRAMAEELAELASGHVAPGPPLLVHHPLEGRLARRYLDHLERNSGARCCATPYSASSGEDFLSSLRTTSARSALPPPLLPLALASNRLTDALASLVGPPLLQRPRFRALLLERLEALP